MKKFITTISLVLNIILVVLFFFFYNSFKLGNDLSDVKSSISTEHNPITNDVALNIIFGKIDSNFNLVLTTITVLFGLFAFLTFIGVKEQFRFQLRALKKKSRIQEGRWTEHSIELLNLKGDLSFEVAEKIQKDINELDIINKENPEYKDFVKHIELVLTSCDYYSQSLIYKKDVYPKFKVAVLGVIKKSLSDTAHLLSSTEKFELDNLGYERFLRLQDNIHKVCDLEDKQNLAFIFSKLSFPTLD
jgi:hypothetical protein